MNLFQIIFIDIIFIMFPLLVYLFYITYTYNVDKKENNLFLDLALLTSFYLVISFGYDFSYKLPFIIYNIPLVIAYIKKRHLSIFMLSSCLILYFASYYELNPIFLTIEYLLYYIIFLLKSKKIKKELTFLLYILV
ncbi:MAG TPA: hypothetical protein GX747_04585, partial [Tenericutes bacterium]|nr:hypothetical protein [Mycoplasmatota bacterium]